MRSFTGLAALLGLRSPSGAVEDSSYLHNDRGLIGITQDSSAVQPGDLYAALPGTKHHGAEFCEQAAKAGAVAVFTDPAGRDLAIRSGLPVFVVAEPRARLGEVASWVYGNPSGRLLLIGVTGTSGKTTSTYLIESGFSRAGFQTGLIGGVETRIAGQPYGDLGPSKLTTPEATELQALLAVMAERQVTATAMEVSSHALTLGRVGGTSFEVAVFTNLSQDHMDFHPDMDSYFAAKTELFTPRYAKSGVVNVDDDYGRLLVSRSQIPVTTFSAAGRSEADWRAVDVRCGADGSNFQVVGPGGVQADASTVLPGPFNVSNALGAIVALVEVGVGLSAAVDGVAACPGVPGRLERVESGHDLTVLVDYSHKPGAVQAVLSALRPVATGKLRIVLGCGGDRDRAKRPMMGAAAAALADVAIFTSDNPRSEDPLAILAEMLAGTLSVLPDKRAHVIIEPDRAAAIGLAISGAGEGDVVLIAGKGHERGQYIAGQVIPFDDREVAIEALAERTRAEQARSGLRRARQSRAQAGFEPEGDA
jgi:UDP-N-acetylmuramoyl-L-alanyl-D-glutamate--2,6-diaminopimelate ligase